MPSSPPLVATTSDHLSTFELFPKLPKELRLLIWNLSKTPRVVSISTTSRMSPGFRCWAQACTPPILHACQESRETALKSYKLSFHVQLRRPIYFDSSIDSLYMTDILTSCSFFRSTKASYQPLAAMKTASIQSSEKAFRIALHYKNTTNTNQPEYQLKRGAMYLAAVFPFTPEIIIVGSESLLSDLSAKKSFSEGLFRPGGSPNDQLRPTSLGGYQLLNGALVDKDPGSLVPEIVFWSQETWREWSELDG